MNRRIRSRRVIHNAWTLLALLHGCMTDYSFAASSVFNVRDFGAAGDGRTADTRAIQAAVEACREAGGGTVLFTAGTYVTGTFRIYGRMTLRLEAGSVILASPDTSLYGLQSAFGLFFAPRSFKFKWKHGKAQGRNLSEVWWR